MIKVIIDGREIETEPQRTILEVAREAGIHIPTLCYHPRLIPIGSCRLCVVEVEGAERPLTACTTYVQDGMVVRTQSEELLKLRQEALKLILLNHPLDCPICDMAGECQLQNLVFELGVDRQDYSLEGERQRGPEAFASPHIRHWPDRCVLCLRCIRADHEIVGARALDLEGTGYEARVVVRAEEKCLDCGECVRVCPVGAMTERVSPVRARPWQRRGVETTCGHCSIGCQMELQVFEGEVIKVAASEEGVNKGSLCCRGFFGFDYLNGRDRLRVPLLKSDGFVKRSTYEEAFEFLASRLKPLLAQGSEAVGALLSARLTNEEAFLLRRFMEEVLGSKRVASTAYFHVAPYRKALVEVLGRDHIPIGLQEVASADCLLVVGDLEGENLIAANLVREALWKKGARLILAYPRRVPLAEEADCFLSYRPGEELLWIDALLRALAEAKGAEGLRQALDRYSPDYVEQQTGIPKEFLEEAAGHLRSSSKVAILVTSLVGQQSQGLGVMKGLLDLALLTGAARPGGGGFHLLGPQSNMVGVADLLEGSPSPLELLRDAASGRLKALILWGEEPLFTCPAGLVRAALESLELLVVYDLLLTPSASKAHVVLPAWGLAESEGTFTNASGMVQRVRRVLEPPEGLLGGGALLEGIASGLGAEFKAGSPTEVFEALKASYPLYKGVEPGGFRWQEGEVQGEPEPVEPQPDGPEGYPYVLMIEGLFFNHHAGWGEKRLDRGLSSIVPSPYLEMNEEDLKAEGIEGRAKVVTPYGEAVLEVRPNSGIKRGVLSLSVGMLEVEATGLVGDEGEVPPFGRVPARVERS